MEIGVSTAEFLILSSYSTSTVDVRRILQVVRVELHVDAFIDRTDVVLDICIKVPSYASMAQSCY